MEEQKQKTTKTPIYKKWWFWLIIAVVAIAIIGIAVGGTGGKDKDNPNNNSNSEGTYYIGDIVKSGDIQFIVNHVYDTKILGTNILGEQTNNNFIVVEMTIKNIGKSEVTLISSLFKLKKDAASYEIHSGSIYLENGFYVLQEVGAGITKKIVVAFETPLTSEAGYTLVVKGKSFATEQEIVLKK